MSSTGGSTLCIMIYYYDVTDIIIIESHFLHSLSCGEDEEGI